MSYTEVYLPPVDEPQVNNNLEPQLVRVRSGNYGKLYIDSKLSDRVLNEYTISSNTLSSNTKNPLVERCRRIAVQSFQLTYDLDNVPVGYNTFTFKVESVFDGFITHTLIATMTPGVYSDVTSLATEMETQINQSIINNLAPGYPQLTLTTSTGVGKDTIEFEMLGLDRFAVDPASPFFAISSPIKSLYQNNYTTPSSDNVFLYIYGYPLDDYIDIISDEYFRDTKMNSRANSHNKHNIVLRIPNIRYGTNLYILSEPLNWVNILYERNIYMLDMQFVTGSGSPLRISDDYRFRWLMSILFEN